jgi:hypothetical protein
VRIVLAFAALVFPAVAASAQGESASSLSSSLQKQVAEDGLLVWSAKDPPSWKDFRGPAKRGTTTAAQTESGVTYLIQCRQSRLAFAVLATFSPKTSWVRPDIPGNSVASRQSLRHERTHFDITELFARRLRRALAGAERVCPGREDEVRRLFDRLAEDSGDEQKRYDHDSAHGMAREAQSRWERNVRASLDSLERYAAPIGRE